MPEFHSPDNLIFILVTIFVAIPPTIGIIIAIILGFQNKANIQEIHLSINSRLDEWLKMTKLASFAEGFKSSEDIQDEKDKEKEKE
jgi:hypothetical protein